MIIFFKTIIPYKQVSLGLLRKNKKLESIGGSVKLHQPGILRQKSVSNITEIIVGHKIFGK